MNTFHSMWVSRYPVGRVWRCWAASGGLSTGPAAEPQSAAGHGSVIRGARRTAARRPGEGTGLSSGRTPSLSLSGQLLLYSSSDSPCRRPTGVTWYLQNLQATRAANNLTISDALHSRRTSMLTFPGAGCCHTFWYGILGYGWLFLAAIKY